MSDSEHGAKVCGLCGGRGGAHGPRGWIPCGRCGGRPKKQKPRAIYRGRQAPRPLCRMCLGKGYWRDAFGRCECPCTEVWEIVGLSPGLTPSSTPVGEQLSLPGVEGTPPPTPGGQ